MSSERRILASQSNGSQSLGPVTAEGKQISSLNAITHGLLSKILVLNDESATAFQELLDAHIARFKPVDLVELAAVQELVASVWRLRRAWAVETQNFNSAPVDPSDPPMARIAAALSHIRTLGTINKCAVQLDVPNVVAMQSSEPIAKA